MVSFQWSFNGVPFAYCCIHDEKHRHCCHEGREVVYHDFIARIILTAAEGMQHEGMQHEGMQPEGMQHDEIIGRLLCPLILIPQ